MDSIVKTNSYTCLRDFIIDEYLLDTLDKIEKELGYVIRASELTEEENKSYLCTVLNTDEGWIFEYGSEKLEQDHICHELMHLCLFIEGWPSYLENDIHDVFNIGMSTLISLIQHIVVWPRVKLLGYDERQYEQEIVDIIPLIKNRKYYDIINDRRSRQIMQAIYFSHNMNCPISDRLLAEHNRTAGRFMTTPFKLASRISKILTSENVIDSTNSHRLLAKILKILDLPQELAIPVYPENVTSGFFNLAIMPIYAQNEANQD